MIMYDVIVNMNILIVILLPIEYSFGGPSIPPHSHLELGKLTTD